MNFQKGETILIEMENGYRWEAEVLEYVEQELDDEYIRAEVGGHPALGGTVRAIVDLDDKRVSVNNLGTEGYEAIWRR